MTPQDYEALQARLRSLADPAYQAFQQKLVPDVTNLLGVRVPALRQLARELVRGDWRGYLEAARHDTYEETMLQGLVLGCARMEQNELFARLAAFVPHIDNWAVCDVTCGGTIKPDVVLYEEQLDETVLMGAVEALSQADLLIVGGTSLAVYPAAGLVRYCKGRLAVINMSPTPLDAGADLLIQAPIGETLKDF